MSEKWLADRLAYLRGLKSPSDTQRLLLFISDKPDRTPEDERKLAALIRAERAADRAQRARAAAGRLIAADKEAERKARTRKLIELGGLVEIAGLTEMDRGTLLGLMLAGAGAANDPERAASWKTRGDAAIAEREKGKEKAKA